MFTPHVVFLFIALTLSPAESVGDFQALQVSSRAACEKLVATYDAANLQANAANAPAFRNTWDARCVMMFTNAHIHGA